MPALANPSSYILGYTFCMVVPPLPSPSPAPLPRQQRIVVLTLNNFPFAFAHFFLIFFFGFFWGDVATLQWGRRPRLLNLKDTCGCPRAVLVGDQFRPDD